MKQNFYIDLIKSAGYFDTGLDDCKPMESSVYWTYPQIHKGNITKDTKVIYFPGCFAYFHDGHKRAVLEMVKRMEELGDDYLIVIAPSNSDYTMEKYGNIPYASNKFRYDMIDSWIDKFGNGNIVIDIMPMLAYDRDHNFPDLLENFLKGFGLSLEEMYTKPAILAGKDREYFKNIASLTDKIEVYYYKGDNLSSSRIIDNLPDWYKILVPKNCILRCKNEEQFNLFKSYFLDEYDNVYPSYLRNELKSVETLVKKTGATHTICRDYAGVLDYIKLSRKFENPLKISNEFNHSNDLNLKDVIAIDSDSYTGATREYFLFKGGVLHTVLDVIPNFWEIVDFRDFVEGVMVYPNADVSWRCSMKPFTKETHVKFNEFMDKVKDKWISYD